MPSSLAGASNGGTYPKTVSLVVSIERTGERVAVPEKFVVTFKPGKEMEEKVLELDRKEAARQQQATQTQSTEYVGGNQPTTPSGNSVASPPLATPESQPQVASSHSPN